MARVMFDNMIRPTTLRAAMAVAASLWLGAFLSGCAPSVDEVRARHDSAGASTAAASARPPGAASAGNSDAELVMAVALSKAKLPIEVRFRLQDKPVTGHPVRIELVVAPLPTAQIRSLQLRLQPGPEMQLQGDSELALDPVTPGVAMRREIVLVPQVAGVLEFEAVATLETNADSLSQTYAIPLVVQASANPG